MTTGPHSEASPSAVTASRADLLPDAARVPFRQLRIFAVIGVMSTLAYVALYAGLRSAMSAAFANGLSLLLTAIGNTAANRRLTFNVRGRAGLARHHLAGVAAFAVALGITSGCLGLLQAFVSNAGKPLELTVLVGANVVATLARFILLRSWIDDGRTVSRVPIRATERISR